MKRTLVSLLTLLTLSGLSVFTSCQKDTTGDGTSFHATMEPATDGKTVLSGTALNWVSGDQVKIFGTSGWAFFSAIPQTPANTATLLHQAGTGEIGNGPFRAFYPTTLTINGETITLPDNQLSSDGSLTKYPMYAESDNNQLAFKNLCGALKLHLTKANTNISSISVITDREITGVFSINYNNGNPELTYVSGGLSSTMLSCATAQSIDNGKDFYIYLPAGSYTGLRLEINTDEGLYCIKTANTNISVARSQYTSITLGESDLTFTEPHSQGSLTGLFSVSATKQVRFSQGNLQYQASTSTWRFAEHQYDFVGGVDQYGEQFGNVYEEGVQCQNNLISSAYTGWIDLFNFGCSGWNNGSTTFAPDNTGSTYDINYFPSDGEYYDDNGQRISLTGEHADWAWHNPIQNGGNQVHMWRTMTEYEWDYLLFNRTASTINGVQNARFAKARVNGVAGLILFGSSS